MDEKTMEFLEENIPEMAKAAVEIAYWDALAAGFTVFLIENGCLMEMSPNGVKKKVKSLSPSPLHVKKGQRLKFR